MELTAIRLLALVICFVLGACARAAPRDTGVGADVGPRTDAPTLDTRPAIDAGRLDAGAVTDARVDARATDSGRTDAPRTDAPGTDAGTDAGGPGVCTDYVDISGGGVFPIDTCALRNSAGAPCGVPTAFDAVLSGDAPGSGSTYSLSVPTGWIIQQLDSTCGASPFSCTDTGFWSVSGGTFPPRWYFAVSRADGDCGPVDVTVNRSM